MMCMKEDSLVRKSHCTSTKTQEMQSVEETADKYAVVKLLDKEQLAMYEDSSHSDFSRFHEDLL